MQRIHDVRDYGATSDGTRLCTEAIQAALDAAGTQGGGIVRLSGGTFLSGTLHMRSRVTLEIDPGTVLLGSPDIEDYPPQGWPMWWPYQEFYAGYWRHLIVAHDVEDITIRGGGEINGNGHHFWHEMPNPTERRWIKYDRPRVERMLMFRSCRNVRLQDVRLQHAPAWNVQFFECDRVWVRGVQVRGELFGPNIDGFDVQGCADVLFSDCEITTGDDAFVMFPSADRDCERVTVTNCSIRTNCVAFKVYLYNRRAARDMVFSNSVVHHTPRAVGLYAFDHGLIENIAVTNVVADTDSTYWLNRPLTIEAKHSPTAVPSEEAEKRGTIRNVLVSQCIFRTDGRILMSASDDMTIERVTLRDLILQYPVLEDPHATAKGVTSLSCLNHSDAAREARAAVVAENIDTLAILNLQVEWPHPDPFCAWGGLTDDAGTSIPYPGESNPPFHLVWSHRVRNSLYDNPLANASTEGVEKYLSLNCTPLIRG